MKKIILSALIVSTTLLINCKGKDGDIGPTGINGTNGTNGTNGNANVITHIITTTNTDWIFNSTYNSWSCPLAFSEITQDVLDNGTVNVFYSAGSNVWMGMPSQIQITQHNYDYGLGSLALFVTNSDLTAPANPSGGQYKIVIIPKQ